MISDEKLQQAIKWTPHEGQIPVLKAAEEGKREIVLSCGRRWGKALALDTPILTTKGWSDMGSLEVGDQVFGPDGLPKKVLDATEVLYSRPTYEVVFSDGSTIVADEEHQWSVETKSKRKNDRRGYPKQLEVLTTKEMADNLVVNGESNYSIPLASPVEFPQKDVPIHPYVFGAWLGDGLSLGGRFYTEEMVSIFATLGYTLEKKPQKYAYLIKGIQPFLKQLGVFGRKHIPNIYKFSSYEQRLALVQGLMDTDGTIGTNGQFEFCVVNERLARDVHEVILSLGIKAMFYEGNAVLNGRVVSKRYRIRGATTQKIFRLLRKVDRLPTKTRSERRFIRSITLVPTVPVRCIQVEGELYLAGKELITTHNSNLAAYLALKPLLGVRKNIWVVSPTYDLSQKVFNYAVRWFAMVAPSQRGGIANRPYPKIKTAKGSLLECKSAENPTSLLGEELDLLIIDEASRVPRRVWEQYLFPTLASRKGSAIFISTPLGKNWFYEEWVKAKDHGAAFNMPSFTNPHFSKDEWDRAKEKLPADIFSQEYEAQFLDDAAQLFKGVNNCIGPTDETHNPDHHYVMGVDLGKHNDFTVITVIDTYNNHVVYIERFNKIDYNLQKERIKAVAKRYNARVLVDSTGVGDPIFEDLRRDSLMIDDYKYSGSKSKARLIDKLSIFIQQGRITYPDHTILIDELNSFGYTISDNGTIKYSAPNGYHDDCVNSLALAVWQLSGEADNETVMDVQDYDLYKQSYA